MKIDAHQHFWQPARGDYDWMPKDIPVLNRANTPAIRIIATGAARFEVTE